METVATLAVGLIIDMGTVASQLNTGLDKMSSTVTGWGKKTAATISAPLLGISAVIGKVAIDFDKEMRNVNATLQLSEAEFQNLKADVLALSLETRASSADVARSLLGIVHAGVDAADTFDLLDVAAHAAGAGLTTTEATTKLLIATMQAYGYTVEDATEIMDRFIFASQHGAGTFDELTQSVGGILPLASAAGIGIDEVTGALIALRKGGLDSAAASVSLTRAIQKILDPTELMEQLFERAGYASGLAAIEGLGLAGVMKLIADETGGSADEIIEITGLIQAWRGVLIMAKDDANVMTEATELMATGFEGAMNAARTEQYKSLSAQWGRLKSAAEVLGLMLFDVVLPPFVELVKYLVPIVRGFAEMDEKTKKMIVTIVGVGIALGPALLLLGKLLALLSFLISPVGLVAAAIAALVVAWKTDFAGMRDVVDSVFLAIRTAAAAVVSWFQENWPIIQGVLLTVWEIIKAVAESIISVFQDQVLPSLQAAWASLTEALAKLGLDWSDVWNAIVGALKIVVPVIVAIILALIGVIVGIVTALAEVVEHVAGVISDMAGTFKKGLKAISKLIGGAMAIIKGIFTGDMELIKTGWLAWVEGLMGIIVAFGEGVVNVFNLTFGTIIALVVGFIKGVIGFFTDLKDALVGGSIVPEMMSLMVSAISAGITEILGLFSGMVIDVVTTVSGLITQLYDVGENLMSSLKSGIETKVAGILGVFSGMGSDIITTISGFANQFYNVGKSLMSSLKDGIEAKIAEIISAVKKAIQDIIDAAEDVLDMFSPSGVFMDIGEGMMEGLALGIQSAATLPVMAAKNAIGDTYNFSMEVRTNAPVSTVIEDFDLLRNMAGV